MSLLKLCAFADESSPTVAGQVEALQRNHIQLLEVRNVDGVNISKLTPNEAKTLKNTLDKNGLAVWSLGSPLGKIDLTDDFAPHLELFKQSLETARILNAKCIRLFSFFTKDYSPAALDEVCRRLNLFLEAAEGSGVLVCHENEKGIYGDVAARCLQLHRALPKLKAVFDPANFVQCGQDTKEAWQLLEPYVYYFHLKDALPNGQVVPAGCGAGNLPWLIRQYRSKANASGVMTLEPHLKIFGGLAGLEQQGEQSKIDDFAYPTNEAAFDAAVTAVEKIINGLDR